MSKKRRVFRYRVSLIVDGRHFEREEVCREPFTAANRFLKFLKAIVLKYKKIDTLILCEIERISGQLDKE